MGISEFTSNMEDFFYFSIVFYRYPTNGIHVHSCLLSCGEGAMCSGRVERGMEKNLMRGFEKYQH